MKNFFMPKDGKTKGIVVKNIIILAVLVAVCGLGVWSWFTQQTSATADGISVICKGEGVEVSWDNKDFYYNLTERETQAAEGSDATTSTDTTTIDTVGPAKNLCDSDGNPLSLNLITGNGLKFFEPYLNRRTGTTLLNADSSWKGVVVNDSNSEGRYVDLDLYFRSDQKRDVYLSGDSKVSPKTPDGNYSDYGKFSKDYIAAASRVAFLNADKTACSFIWAPNANVELIENESGYKKVTDTVTEEVVVSGGSDGVLNGGAVNDGKTYYLWTFKDELIDTNAKGQNSSYLDARQFTYDDEIKYFVTTVDFYIPTYEQNNPSIPIIINNSDQRSALSSSDSANIAGYNSLQGGLAQVNQHFYVANGEFNLDNNSIQCTNKMYADSQYIKSGEHISVKFGYNPATDLLTILDYETSGGQSFSLGGDEEEVTAVVTYYPVDTNVTCVLANPDSNIALSSVVNYRRKVLFSDGEAKQVVAPISATTKEQFTTVKTGDGYSATYKFLNVNTNTYLAISSGKVTLSTTGTEFSLSYVKGVEGPVLTSEGYYLSVKNGVIAVTELSALNASDVITVYVGTSYQLLTEKETDNQTYEYYDYDDNTVWSLHSASTPKLFSSFKTTTAATKIGNTKIVTLTKANETDEYYTAHIVVRIWVEGTDREAKTPLGDGVFDVSLIFTSV